MRLLDKYNEVSNGMQHAFLLIGIVFIAGMTYSVMSADISTLKESKDEMRHAINAINEKITTITIEQAVQTESFNNMEEKQREFRQRTDAGLEKILDRLNR